jgi:cysteinyl-tRNA synthetase
MFEKDIIIREANMLRIYNTLSRSVEEFQPIDAENVRIYACGPTVYDYQHIGHMRRYMEDDILVRVLRFDGYKVKYVMNITDVGHLTSDADEGQDKMEKGAEKYGTSVFDIAKKFENQFLESLKLLNIDMPDNILKATEYIKEQIELVQVLEEKGFTYKTADGIYFDTSKFPDYNQLSKQPLRNIKAGARVALGGKKNPTDFALWKFSYPSGRSFDSAQDDSASRRQMEWKSPWGIGFPGWHIECSAMSMKALGISFDIHTGGIDHINIHHTNEIAQSEAASGKKFVNYWIHHNFLVVENQKMSKSLGNFYTVEDIVKSGFDPLSLRYLYLQTHYRQEMNFTFQALRAAQNTLNRLRLEFINLKKGGTDKKNAEKYANVFLDAINDDLNMSKALALMWEMLKADLPEGVKKELLLSFDKVFGLDLENSEKYQEKVAKISEEVLGLVSEREKLRKERKFHLADKIRAKIQKLGYDIEDKDGRSQLKPIE